MHLLTTINIINLLYAIKLINYSIKWPCLQIFIYCASINHFIEFYRLIQQTLIAQSLFIITELFS